MSRLSFPLPSGIHRLLRRRGSTVMAVLGMSLGIAASLFAFAVLDAAIFGRVHLPESDRLFFVDDADRKTGLERWMPELVEDPAVVEGFIVWTNLWSDLECAGFTRSVRGARISSDFATTLRVPYLYGGESEHVGGSLASGSLASGSLASGSLANKKPAVVIGERVWRECFYRDPEIIGRSVRIKEREFRVAGVMPEGFFFPLRQDFWLPTAHPEGERPELVVRLRRGASASEFQKEAALRADRDLQVVRYGRHLLMVRQQTQVLILFSGIALILGLACFNVSHLIDGYVLLRSPDFAVHLALGASRRHIFRMVIAESFWIAVMGGLLGCFLAISACAVFNRLMEMSSAPFWYAVVPDMRLALVAAGIVLAATFLAGVAPSLRAYRLRMSPLLGSAPRSLTTPGARWSQHLAIVFQVIGSCVVLLMAMVILNGLLLFFQSEKSLTIDDVFAASVDLSKIDAAVGDGTRGETLVRVRDAVSALPEVRSVSFATMMPSFYQRDAEEVLIRSGERTIEAKAARIGVEYFQVFGLFPEQGRLFEGEDPGQVVIDQTFAAALAPILQKDPQAVVGERFFVENTTAGELTAEELTVVGVVPDLPIGIGAVRGAPMYFSTVLTDPPARLWMLLKTDDLASLVTELPSVFDQVAPGLEVGELHKFTKIRDHGLFSYRVVMFFLFSLALTGLLLTSVGIYGIVDLHLHRYERDIAIRRACGATSQHLLALSVRRILPQVLIGLVSGVGAFYLVGRFVPEVFMRTTPWILWSTPFLIVGITLVAAWMPTRRIALSEDLSSLSDGR